MEVLGVLRDERNRARTVFSLGIIGGFLTILFYLLFRQDPNITFGVFYSAAESAMAGDIIYRTEHGLYVYTPVVVLFFYPFVWLFEFQTAVVAFRVLNIFWVVIYAAIVVRFVDDITEISLIDRLLIGGFVAGSIYPVTVIATANLGIIFGSLLGIGYILLERNRTAGGAVWALAALIKVFPALWGLYLLRIHRWKAIGAAILTGVSATALGILLYGLDAYIRFITTATSDRVRIQQFAGGASPDNEAVTPIRPLSQLFPTLDPQVWTPIIIFVVVSLTVAVFYLLSINDITDRATILLATIIGITLVMPTSQDLDMYLLYVPLIVLLFLERDAAVHVLYSLGTVVMSFNVGREELRTVAAVLGDHVATTVMVVGEPVLSFASMPLYGLGILYIGCLLKAWRCGRETGQIRALRRTLYDYKLQ